MKVTLLACYEQGHQPMSLALPLAVLRRQGLDAEAFDLSLQRFPSASVAGSKLVAISTPMHTALKLGVTAAEQARRLNPEAHICFYGSYAWLNGWLLLSERQGYGKVAGDSVIGGEFEQPLQDLALALASGRPADGIPGVMTSSTATGPYLRRLALPVPDRSTLPAPAEYAKLAFNGRLHTTGYTESSRGCLHRCLHCPVVPVYGGRFYVIAADTVLADIEQQVERGARHITFGDPDFLNGPGHAMKIARALRRDFPGVTFDFTTKVEHIIENRHLLPELKALGAAFVVSAFESTNNQVLARLDKGHTLEDMDAALAILKEAELPVQATWVPFTPWTSLDDYLHMLSWIRSRRLIQHVAAVQLSIRLLVPPGSALLDHKDSGEWLGPLDENRFTYRWEHADPRMDELQRSVAMLVERRANAEASATFEQIEGLAYGIAGKRRLRPSAEPYAQVAPPRLTEDWFC